MARERLKMVHHYLMEAGPSDLPSLDFSATKLLNHCVLLTDGLLCVCISVSNNIAIANFPRK